MKYSEKLEWECLQDNINLTSYKLMNDIPLYSIKSCNLKRGENFEIILDITCKFDYRNKSFFDNTFYLNKLIFENSREEIKLKHCKLKDKTFTAGENAEYNFIFHVTNVKKTTKSNDLEKEIYYIKEWYINSIHDNLVFTRPTRYNVTHEYVKIRDKTPCDNIEVKEEYPPNTSEDHLLLTLDDFNIILQKVPDNFGPEWSNNLGIEYHGKYGIPPSNVRRKVSEIISFLLGRNLIKIGETFYDAEWNVIGEIGIESGVSPRLNLKTISNYRDLPAIKYHGGFLDMFDWEIYSSEIISAYLNCELDLSQIIENLLMSMCVPTEAEIVMIGGCLDEIIEKWFKSNQSPSEGKIIEANEFKDIISEELSSIKEKLIDNPYFYTKIENSYNVTGRKRLNLFLKEVGIKIGKSEEKGREYRNIPAHGHKISPRIRFKMMYVTDIYRSFVNRVILKLLGFHSYYNLTSGKMMWITETIPEKNINKDINELERFYYEHYKI